MERLISEKYGKIGYAIWPRIETWKSARNMEKLISEKHGKID